MAHIDPKHVDPRLIDLAARQPQPAMNLPRGNGGGVVIPGRGPVTMPMAMPGPQGGINRYREMTLEEMLLENRVVFLVGEINHVSAVARHHADALPPERQEATRTSTCTSTRPGGVVDDTLAIYDIMKFLTCDIATYCIGRAESGGAIVFMAGKKGKRYILPNAKVMIHQPFGGVYGQAADIEIQAEEILKTKDTLINIMAKCTGQTADKIREDSERDRFFDAKQAVEVRHLRRGDRRGHRHHGGGHRRRTGRSRSKDDVMQSQ